MGFTRTSLILTISFLTATTLYILIMVLNVNMSSALTYSSFSWSPRELFFVKEVRQPSKEYMNNVKLLCWVMTMKKNLQTRTVYVKKTWAKRCDVVLYFGSEEVKDFPVIGLKVKEGRQHLTEKTYSAFRYIYKHFLDKGDWFMKADDDAYVIVDNLKYFLSKQNTSEPQYIGLRMEYRGLPKGFNSGGAGYILSKEALRRFGKKGNDEKMCPYRRGIEDVEMGLCMYNLGVKINSPLDDKNGSLFHSHTPYIHLHPHEKWPWVRGVKTGAHNISRYPFSFHYITGQQMETMELLIYHTKHRSNNGTVLP